MCWCYIICPTPADAELSTTRLALSHRTRKDAAGVCAHNGEQGNHRMSHVTHAPVVERGRNVVERGPDMLSQLAKIVRDPCMPADCVMGPWARTGDAHLCLTRGSSQQDNIRNARKGGRGHHEAGARLHQVGIGGKSREAGRLPSNLRPKWRRVEDKRRVHRRSAQRRQSAQRQTPLCCFLPRA